MDAADYFEQHLRRVPVMGIFRGLSPERTVELCERAWSVGVDLVEVPVADEQALPSFLAAKEAAASRGKQVGVGTVLSVGQLETLHAHGAAFTVSPGLSVDVARRSIELGIPHLPGVATASDITAALDLGLRWVKAFPAEQLGTGWIAAQSAPFAEVAFVATGGIDATNLTAFLDAGCRAVAIGSAFGDDEAIVDIAKAVQHRRSR